MAEINSIANGSFVLGQTSATNFVAGNGIKIDEPSAGTVRIGNDETVLYSGNATITATTSINTSEPYRNFERLAIYGRGVNDQVPRLYGECICTTERYCPLMFTYPDGPNNTLRIASFHLDFNDSDNTKIILAKGKVWNLSNNAVSTGSYGGTISHIIGINRINGGNE